VTSHQDEWLRTTDTGERRRRSDGTPVTGELIDEATVQGIADESWLALVGEEEFLVPVPEPLPADVVSSWVQVSGPWNGTVVLTVGRETAAELTRALLGEHAPEVLEPEDVQDALGELANVVGGNVKGVLPAPSLLGLPEVGEAPQPADPADVVRIDVLWRGQPMSIAVQGATRALVH
jgi:chemotaxis protein CheX